MFIGETGYSLVHFGSRTSQLANSFTRDFIANSSKHTHESQRQRHAVQRMWESAT